MPPTLPRDLEQDNTPFSSAAMGGLILLALFGYMFGPAITAFFGLAWPKRPGARVLAVVGVACIILHTAIFLLGLAAPTWYPQLQRQFPNLPEPRISDAS